MEDYGKIRLAQDGPWDAFSDKVSWPDMPDSPEDLSEPTIRLDFSNLEGQVRFTFDLEDRLAVIRGLMDNRKQAELALKLGLSQASVSQKLSGQRPIGIDELDIILDALGYNVQVVATLKEQACTCAFTERGCTCQTFDATNGGTI